MLQKIAKRYYIIFQLVRTGIPHGEIVQLFLCNNTLEYECAVWHTGLTTAQYDEDIERVQKRCRRIISYNNAFVSGLAKLSVRPENIG
jgi:hypothetical protein